MIQKLYRELSSLREQFDAYWKEAGHIGFNSENPYYEPIRNLVARINERLMLGEALDVELHDVSTPGKFLNVIANDPAPVRIVKFNSDPEGNYYFNGRKVLIEYSSEHAYSLRKTKIRTNCKRPVDFYFNFLDHTGLYGTYGNPYSPATTSLILCKYLN